jgi:glycosyltransferase involved in cell wall biosynthesis
VGGTSPFPNLDALVFFCEQVLPQIRAAFPAVRATWIGRATPAQQTYYRDRHNVELTGYVDDVRPLMHAAACHVVPLRAGGGTRVKILNSWAMGKAVISTSNGCEGLAAVDGGNILIRDDPAAFAGAVIAALQDPALRRRLGEEGRATVERLYSWDVISRDMLSAYAALSTQTRDAHRVASPVSHRISAAGA